MKGSKYELRYLKENQKQTLAHFGRELCRNQSVDGKTRFGYAQSDTTKMDIYEIYIEYILFHITSLV